MIYIDPPKYYPSGQFSHMAADSIKELHEFAKLAGVKECWYSNVKGKYQPHYDVAAKHYEFCIALGAIPTGRRELLLLLRDAFKPKRLQFKTPLWDKSGTQH